MPPELNFALAVDVSNLRPWEYWQMDAAELYLIQTLRNAWQAGRAGARGETQGGR